MDPCTKIPAGKASDRDRTKFRLRYDSGRNPCRKGHGKQSPAYFLANQRIVLKKVRGIRTSI